MRLRCRVGWHRWGRWGSPQEWFGQTADRSLYLLVHRYYAFERQARFCTDCNVKDERDGPRRLVPKELFEAKTGRRVE
jgi:hypothetical protein